MSFIMNYPTVAPTNTVILGSPHLGNTHRISSNSVLHRNRSGDVRTVQIAAWPNVESDLYVFTVESASIISDLEAFLEACAGDEVQIIDHDGVTRVGYILNNVAEIITLRDNCLYDVQIEFVETVS
jgi:hypothetical protein